MSYVICTHSPDYMHIWYYHPSLSSKVYFNISPFWTQLFKYTEWCLLMCNKFFHQDSPNRLMCLNFELCAVTTWHINIKALQRDAFVSHLFDIKYLNESWKQWVTNASFLHAQMVGIVGSVWVVQNDSLLKK